jgi:putative FmdB family regulatory protein
MPIYEYRCTQCEHEMEALQKISDQPLIVCPVCEKESLVKKISAAGFRLSGTGWYETDFKTGKKKNIAGDGGSSSQEGSTTGDTAKSSGSSKTSSESSASSGAG